MKQNTKNFKPGIKLHNIILFAGIFTILFFAPRVSKAQIETGSFEFEGLTRNYLVFLPQNYQPNMPVVFNLHGYTSNAQKLIDYTLMNEVADTSGFIVVYPNAVYPGFNSGVWIPWTPHLDTTINDVGFISALIDTINVHYDIDTKRVYCCGFSNGGQMTNRLSCQLGHRFAAAASVSGLISDISAAGCLSNPPIPILHMHGTADDLVPYNGNTYVWSAEETLNFWLDKNGCSFPADTVFLPDLDPTDGCAVQKISYTNCEDNSSLIFYKVIDGGHSWPGAPTNPGEWAYPTNRDINANIEIWNFFKDYPPIHCLPEGITLSTQEEIDNFPSKYAGCSEIGGSINISSSLITNLDSLYVIKSIRGSLSISGCSALNSLKGLDGLEFIEGDLKIINNNSLSDCEAIGICNYLSSPNGEILIENNAFGCNSQEEVQDSCLVSIEEHGVMSEAKIHPNPFTTSTTIAYELQQTATVQITIYNHLGKQLEVIQQTQSAGKQQVVWNAEGLPSGVYFCVIKNERGTQTMKMIKLK